jgi:HAD superfamily hydrolase (TIGR01549 family)
VTRRRPVISTILFDAGGTLVYLDYFFLSRELRRRGIMTTPRAIRRAEFASKAAIDRRMLHAKGDTDETRRQPYFTALLERLGVTEPAITEITEYFDAAHKQDNLWRVMMPSTPGVLAALCDRGFTLGVVSNADGRITSILRKCGILPFFSAVVDSHEVRVEKPDPRIFSIALRQTGAHPEQAIYVGDIYSIDVVGAQRAGIRPLLLDAMDSYDTVRCEKIRHLRELLTLLEV